MASRILVLLIMTRRVPDMFLHVRGAHIHHLNYGIFILSLVGAILLFRPEFTQRGVTRALYGVGLALTFDEFGMWVHLGGSYWQRASYDAVITIAGVLLLFTVAPRLRGWKLRHWLIAGAILAGTGLLSLLMATSLHELGHRWGERLHSIEEEGPP